MSNPKWEEQIIVVKRDMIFDGENDTFQGLLEDVETLNRIGSRFDDYRVMRRGNANDPTPPEENAEINYDFKQPIPYVVVRRGEEIFMYKRLSGGGEGRLFDKFSIGVGGHMNLIKDHEGQEVADDFSSQVFSNMIRELNEELVIEGKVENQIVNISLSTLGFINNDNDEVGGVHFGILVVADVADDVEVNVAEVDQLEGEWVTIDELKNHETFEKLEAWSQIALEAFE